MDEDVAPDPRNCPKEILEVLTEPKDDWANAWREEALKRSKKIEELKKLKKKRAILKVYNHAEGKTDYLRAGECYLPKKPEEISVAWLVMSYTIDKKNRRVQLATEPTYYDESYLLNFNFKEVKDLNKEFTKA